MKKTLEVVDDFYRNPMSYREQALKCVELVQRGKKSSVYSESITNESLDDDEVTGRIFRILGLGSSSAPRAVVRGYFVFRGEDTRDPLAMQFEDSGWAGFVCLSLPERCSGGIWFYRREQATPCDPATEVTLDGSGHSIAERLPAFRNPELLMQAEAYQVSIYLPLRFNRMVLFQTSALGYGVSPGSENTFEPGLLVQVLAFSE